ncbi:hypothetical protein Q2490_07695 [Myroides odoratimimus]|uniref:hypothetical protein n=1 Tax=Myroides odoratimimus TaxID=76832 RepID=UPI0026E04632|nr:hypothetical protein [Myroides odoratimimus]MDO5857166.1 hypothetical protein [Myroides odoratimimus]
MKKITLIAALLGTTYFANAQVGIGTPDPATSAELDIVAKSGNKGILIPRVTLTAESVFAPITGTQQESLLVYNNVESTSMPKGFYYWDGAKWNRIIGKTELNTVVENLGDNITTITNDVKNLQAVVNYILPSNPDNTDPTKPGHTTIVYDNTTGDMYEVVYDVSTKEYITKKIDLLKMIQAKETNTFFKEIKENGKITGYVYFNEKTIVDWLAKDKSNTIDNIPNDALGAVTVDVKGTVVNNFKEILEATTTITVTTNEGDKTFTTVEEYLQYITQFSEGNVIYKNISTDPNKPNWVLQYWDETKGEYTTINLTDLVASVETKTNILRTEAKDNGKLETYAAAGAPIVANVKKGEIFYKYNNEDKGEQFINMTADIISSINNNEEVKNALTNILNQGGNVYFGDVKGKEVFYTMKIVNGKEEKTPIELPASFILDIINKYKDIVKNALGDHIDNTTTIVNTGNTYNGKMVFLAKGKTTVGKEEGGEKLPSPLTTGVTLDLTQIKDLTSIQDVLTVTILKGGKVVASTVADLIAAGNTLKFAIGTGAFYTALPYGEYEVVVEFTGNITVPMTPIIQP